MTAKEEVRSGTDIKYEKIISDLRDRIADLEMYLSEAKKNIAMLRIVARQSDGARHTAINAIFDQFVAQAYSALPERINT